jgi:hypothetical protein
MQLRRHCHYELVRALRLSMPESSESLRPSCIQKPQKGEVATAVAIAYAVLQYCQQ